MKRDCTSKDANVWIKVKRFFQWAGQTHAGMTIISLILSLVFLVILIMIFGSNPGEVMGALFTGAFRGKASVASTFEEMAILVLCSLAILVPYKGGFFNIGAQGQLEVSGLVTALVALYCPGPPTLVIFISIMAGVLAAILVSLIPLFLRNKRGASEVTTGIMLNYVCTLFVYAMIYGPFMEKGAFFATTERIPKERLLPDISGISVGIIIALILCLITYILINRTSFGMKLQASGYNPKASTVLGINVKTIMNRGVFFGAAMAGLAGSYVVLGITARVSYGWASNWAFAGVSIAFLGGNALGVIPIGFLIALIGVGGRHMQAMTGVPPSLVDILKGLPMVIFLLLQAIRTISPNVNFSNIGFGSRRKNALAKNQLEEEA